MKLSMNNPEWALTVRTDENRIAHKGVFTMFNARRRRLAWLFALVLLMGLALLCCASIHVASHDCRGDDCAICAALRPERRIALHVTLASACLSLVALIGASCRRHCAVSIDTPVSLHVRLDD